MPSNVFLQFTVSYSTPATNKQSSRLCKKEQEQVCKFNQTSFFLLSGLDCEKAPPVWQKPPQESVERTEISVKRDRIYCFWVNDFLTEISVCDSRCWQRLSKPEDWTDTFLFHCFWHWEPATKIHGKLVGKYFVQKIAHKRERRPICTETFFSRLNGAIKREEGGLPLVPPKQLICLQCIFVRNFNENLQPMAFCLKLVWDWQGTKGREVEKGKGKQQEMDRREKWMKAGWKVETELILRQTDREREREQGRHTKGDWGKEERQKTKLQREEIEGKTGKERWTESWREGRRTEERTDLHT